MNFLLNVNVGRRLTSQAVFLITLLTLFGATGCAQTGELYKSNRDLSQDEAQLFIYRPDASALKGLGAIIYIDGTPVAKLWANGYVMTKVSPGAHVISERWDTSWISQPGLRGKFITLNIRSQKGEKAYIRLSSDIDVDPLRYRTISFTLFWALKQVSKELALPELQLCRLAKS